MDRYSLDDEERYQTVPDKDDEYAGDYGTMHPDETDEDFWSHEDWDD